MIEQKKADTSFIQFSRLPCYNKYIEIQKLCRQCACCCFYLHSSLTVVPCGWYHKSSLNDKNGKYFVSRFHRGRERVSQLRVKLVIGRSHKTFTVKDISSVVDEN